MKSKKKQAIITALFSLSFGLIGCTTVSPNNQWVNSMSSVTYLTPASSKEVQYAQVGETLLLTDRGKRRYQVQIKKRYFAASGRWCVDAQARDSGWIFCDYGSASKDSEVEKVLWGVSRAFDNKPIADEVSLSQGSAL